MTSQKGFTLVEIVVALIIVGIGAALVVPNLINSMEQTKAQAAKNNLLAISAKQQKYYEDYGYYCSDQAPNATCGSAANLMSNLSLTTTSGDPFTYSCAGAAYTCTADDTAKGGSVTLTVTNTGVVSCTAGGGNCPS
jgi:prepilin-type N-terminal cleavage/methylation domain-containing protein